MALIQMALCGSAHIATHTSLAAGSNRSDQFVIDFSTQGADLKPWLGDAVPTARLIDELHSHWQARDDRYSELHADRRGTGSGKSYPDSTRVAGRWPTCSRSHEETIKGRT
jgi:hypothetical protein